MDKFKIDGHKINYHVERVSQWLTAPARVYPIYIEIAPCGACNHACTFCAVDYIGYKARFLDTKILKERLTEMGRKGVRSVMYAGEGEPLLHRDLADIIRHTKLEAGIDVSITTNAVPLTAKFAEAVLPHTSWIKASVNAGRAEEYARIHRTNPIDFDRAIENIKSAVKIRNGRGLTCAIGIQMVLLPENASTAKDLAVISKQIGADYIVIKPYSQHKMSLTREYDGLIYDDYLDLAEELEGMADDRFGVVFRRRTMEKLKQDRPDYDRCMATPFFWAYVMANGDVYGCSAYLEDRRFNYGNLLEESFARIWEGPKRMESIKYVERDLNILECRQNCRMDEVNRYLWELKHPAAHVNFI